MKNTFSTQEHDPLLSPRKAAKMTFWSVYASCVACLGGFLFGYDLGVVGGMLIAPSFQSHFGIDPTDIIREAEINGTIVSVLQFGCLFGALIATSTADSFGRKKSILLASIVFSVGGVFQIVGYGLAMMYAGRIISGLGVGALSMLVPMYVAEIAHENQRGLLGGLWMFFIATGLATSYWSHYIVRKTIDAQDNLLWRIPLIIQVIPAILLFFGMIFLFETPRWLCAHAQSDQAYLVLSKIRDGKNVKEELEQIQSSVDLERTIVCTWKQVFSLQNRSRLLLGCSLQAWQQLSGTNVINYFSPMVFKSIGLSSGDAELFATGIYGILKMVVVLVGFMSLIDRFGRRPLLIGGGLGMGLCMYGFAICVSSTPTEPSATTSVLTVTAGLGIASMYIYAVFFALSWGPCPWVFCSEIFPMSTRAKSLSITTAVNWTLNALIGKLSPIMLTTSTMATYIFFGSCCVLASIYCYFLVPETKGKTLEEVERLFIK